MSLEIQIAVIDSGLNEKLLLFLERIINQRVEGHNIFHNLFVP